MAMATRNRSLPSPAGTTRPMRASGTNTPSRIGVVALRRAHAERVPGLDDGDAGAVPLDEGVHDLRAARGVGVDGVGAEPASTPGPLEPNCLRPVSR